LDTERLITFNVVVVDPRKASFCWKVRDLLERDGGRRIVTWVGFVACFLMTDDSFKDPCKSAWNKSLWPARSPEMAWMMILICRKVWLIAHSKYLQDLFCGWRTVGTINDHCVHVSGNRCKYFYWQCGYIMYSITMIANSATPKKKKKRRSSDVAMEWRLHSTLLVNKYHLVPFV
jgi:hypothetical protein